MSSDEKKTTWEDERKRRIALGPLEPVTVQRDYWMDRAKALAEQLDVVKAEAAKTTTAEFSARVIPADGPGMGAYLQGSAKDGEAVIYLNMKAVLAAVGLCDGAGAVQEARQAVWSTLAHEIMHALQDTLGAELREDVIERALRDAAGGSYEVAEDNDGTEAVQSLSNQLQAARAEIEALRAANAVLIGKPSKGEMKQSTFEKIVDKLCAGTMPTGNRVWRDEKKRHVTVEAWWEAECHQLARLHDAVLAERDAVLVGRDTAHAMGYREGAREMIAPVVEALRQCEADWSEEDLANPAACVAALNQVSREYASRAARAEDRCSELEDAQRVAWCLTVGIE